MFPESVILVVGGESEESEAVARMLSERYRVIGAEKAEDALSHASDGVDLVISELDSSEFSGVQLLRTWKAKQRRTPFLFLTDGGDVSTVVEAMKLGAADCILKPVDAAELQAAVLRLVRPDRPSGGNDQEKRPNIDIPPGTSLEDLERAAVEQALAQHQGNRTHAAKTLGISVRTLQRKLKAWGLPVLALQNGGAGTTTGFLYSEPPAHTPSGYGAHAH